MTAQDSRSTGPPDVVLMDIRMPVLDGLEATRRLVAGHAAARVLVLTTFDLDEYVFEALRAGASGFLLKDATAEELVGAVRTLAAGDAILAPAVTRRVIEAFGAAVPAGIRPAWSGSRRSADARWRCCACWPEDCRTPRSPGSCSSATRPPKTHVSNVLGKLGLRDRVQAVIFAYESGLIRRAG